MTFDERVQIPELINLHQVGVVVGQDEIGIVFEKEIGHVVEVDQAVQFGGTQLMIPAQFVAQQTGGLGQVVNQLGFLRRDFRGVMVDHYPVGPVQAGLETQIADPRCQLARLALAPGVIVVGFQRDIGVEDLPCQPLKQYSGNQPVEVAPVGEDDLRFGQ